MPSKHTPEMVPPHCGCEWGHGKMCSLHDAAPDLLACLKTAIRYAPTKAPPKGAASAVHDAWTEAKRARAAIAKAEGE